MLAFSLASTFLLLATANYFARRTPPSDRGFWITGFLIVFPSFCLSLFVSPVILLQFALTAIIWIAWRNNSKNPRYFAIASLLAAAAAYIYPTWTYLAREQEYDHLRMQYPIESLDQRLPPRRETPKAEPIPSQTLERLTQVEELAEVLSRDRRIYHLRQLHEEKVNRFIESPGFGVGRMVRDPPNPTERNLKPREDDEHFVPQPSSPGHPSSLFDGSTPLKLLPAEKQMLEMNSDSVINFAYPQGFGFLAGPRQAAGFRSHRFRELPRPAIQRIELIGFAPSRDTGGVHHGESANDGRSRESPHAAARHLRNGSPCQTAEGRGRDRRRGGGGIADGRRDPLAKQCATCHDGNRGELLGAFTYTLRVSK